MTTIQVYDPALCCSTGVCGAEVDQALVSFAADVDWAKQSGAQIERFNLAQQPLAFADAPVVKAFLEEAGQEAASDSGGWPKGPGWSLPNARRTMGRSGPAPQSSILTEQVAELIAMGAAIAANCESCFKHHYDIARKLGAAMRRCASLSLSSEDQG